jgi:hypothetical protein
VSGATIPVDWVAATSVLATITFPPGGAEPVIEILGMVGGGTLELDQAGDATGEPVSGRIVSGVYEPLF